MTHHRNRLLPLALAATLAAHTPAATADGLIDVDEVAADRARVFILVAEVTSQGNGYMIPIEFDESADGAANETACWTQASVLTRRFGRKGWAVVADCIPKATGGLE